MKIGVSAFAWTTNFDRSHLALLPKIQEHGIDGFEIPMFEPTNLAVTEIRRHITPGSERRLPDGIRRPGPGR